MEYAYLLPTYLKLKYSLYIAYIGTRNKKIEWMFAYCYTERKTEQPTKKRTYIYTYIVKKRKGRKVGHKRTQKKGLFCSPSNNPTKVSITKVLITY